MEKHIKEELSTSKENFNFESSTVVNFKIQDFVKVKIVPKN